MPVIKKIRKKKARHFDRILFADMFCLLDVGRLVRAGDDSLGVAIVRSSWSGIAARCDNQFCMLVVSTVLIFVGTFREHI